MIKIERNKNFSEWLNITLFGKLIDNAKTHTMALRIASQIQAEQQKVGNKLPIVSR